MTTIEYLQQRMNAMKHHRVFAQVRNLEQLRTFMEWHVFAVWDFMSLVKRLQNDFTCTTLPWVPKPTHRAARLINDIVLGEETDEAPNASHLSHFELYLEAMTEVSADTQQIARFVSLVKTGVTVAAALNQVEAPLPIQNFVKATLHAAVFGNTNQVLGNFFYGREDAIPQMFRSLLKDWALPAGEAPMFRYYLDRHIELDADHHGPAVQSIIREVVNDEPAAMAELYAAALEAIEHRVALWDALAGHLEAADQVAVSV
ncbi:DUF3050 domain-containing protein [Burkholderia glumae]|uniref:DUF3050 domain-containing protein n=1 Tax=Burkholderia glumae TaxID=337 RepID=UPI0001A4A525|nr:DUF3050 domain-containing protein [Burkholderia glumae]ACR32869.1 Hypothetical protein bglu_3p1180 [Burkholderia glumae BGR1]MCM2543925.1 DUF3050 domain-containing protein [Burkholderia glumae]